MSSTSPASPLYHLQVEIKTLKLQMGHVNSPPPPPLKKPWWRKLVATLVKVFACLAG